MSRLPALPRDQIRDDDHKAAHDGLSTYASATFGDAFTYKDPSTSALVGPFPFFIMSRSLGMDFLQYLNKMSALPGLSVEAKETAILAVGAHYKASYELYAHTNVARKSTSLSDEQVADIAKGSKPEGLSDDCEVAFEVATYLASTPGPLTQELWERSVRALGKEGTVALVHYVGFYAYTCIVLNAMDAPVPNDGE